MNKVAVYGTLRKGHGNHKYLLDREPLSTEHLHGWEMFHLGGFPGAIPVEDQTESIAIEVYEVTDHELVRINRLEGYTPGSDNNTFYDRQTINTSQGPAFIYRYAKINEDNKFNYQKVVTGDWNNKEVIRHV